MSTILNTNGDSLEIPTVLVKEPLRVAIFTAEWNPKITHALRDGAIDVLKRAGVNDCDIDRFDVPGTVELVNAAALAVNQACSKRCNDMPGAYHAVIVIGCVIRGDTPHFDYVCDIVAQGTAQLNAKGETPVIFGVLTVDNEQQALDRAGGCLGNKGAEAAVAAIKMANLHHKCGMGD